MANAENEAVSGGTAVPPPAGPPAAPPPSAPRRPWRRWLLAAGGVVVLGAGLFWGIPFFRTYLTTEYTDDAYVNSHVTIVAPRIDDNVVKVLVEDSFFVESGTLLVQLDPYPYQVIVKQKQAALDVVQAQLEQTYARVRSQEAQARGSWYQLIAAQEQVRSQLAALRANLANLRLARANLQYAQSEQARVERLLPSGAASAEERDQRRNAVRVAESQVASAQEAIQQTRAALGLKRNEDHPLDAPADLEANYSAVQVALSQAAVALAQIGVPLHLYRLTPEKLHRELLNMTPEGDLNKTLDRLVERAPEAQLARSQVEHARADLEQAELNLSYTEIRADVAGFVNRRNVNPGDHVLVGQNLMAIRSFDQVWVDANFKETQLQSLRIGQPVDLAVDAYPNRVFQGRVAGFNAATGSVSALLPPENATGNFVKIVQRLPVRIELTEPNPRDTPLFAGLSVVPTVRLNETPTGPNAGERIRASWQSAATQVHVTPPTRTPAAGRKAAPAVTRPPAGVTRPGARGGVSRPPAGQASGPVLP